MTRHHEVHDDLLAPHRQGPDRQVDAIVVPAGRPASNLEASAELAAELGCRLLVVTSSRGARPRDVLELQHDRSELRLLCVDVPDDYEHRWLVFPGTRLATSGPRSAPLATKRNLGLLLARMVGWQTLLFLDDDIRGLTASTVRSAASGLDQAAAVGMRVAGYPDNSVVCHANRLGGGRQGTFVSGSALLVDMTADVSFFPDVYNEDWLFLHDWLKGGRVARTGRARQVPYDPFEDRTRAGREEFGDVIAEGVAAALHAGTTDQTSTTRYWETFLRARATFVRRVHKRVADRPYLPFAEKALAALQAADAARRDIDAEQCANYVCDWRSDHDLWIRRLAELPRCSNFDMAAVELEFDEHKTLPDVWTGRPWRRPSPHTVTKMPATPPPTTSPTTFSAPRDVAVILPGFLDSKDYSSSRALALALSSGGTSAYRLDLHGSWSNPGGPDEYLVTLHLAQITELLDRVMRAGDRCILIGFSYGGNLALLQAAQDSRVTDVVALMPTRSFIWTEDYDERRDTWRRSGRRTFARPRLNSSTEIEYAVAYPAVVDARTYNITEELSEIRARALFLAGGDDQFVPTHLVRNLYRECGSRDEDKTFVTLPGVHHDYRHHPDQVAAVNDEIVGWVARTTPVMTERSAVPTAAASA